MTNRNIHINKALRGDAVITQQIVRKDGSIADLTIEQFVIQNQGEDVDGTWYMFIVNGCSNFLGYSTARKAINAAAKTTC